MEVSIDHINVVIEIIELRYLSLRPLFLFLKNFKWVTCFLMDIVKNEVQIELMIDKRQT